MTTTTNTYTLRDGTPVTVRRLAAGDAANVVAFLRTMPERDLLFFRQDVSSEDVIRSWATTGGPRETVATIAERDGTVLAIAYVQHNTVPWLRHVGDIVAIVHPSVRGQGLGTQLLRDAILNALDLKTEKIAARIAVEDRESIRVFEKLGFRHEGLLLDHAKGSDGTTYDLAALGLNVAANRPLLEAAGAHLDLTKRA
jgi:L-amino acid N-acyltransferase YncA